MLDDLIIINLPPNAPVVSSFLEWKTCLRRIVFLNRRELALLKIGPDMDLYQGSAAYRFLLEVVCGLHSPLLGETAVMGQFRKLRANANFPVNPWGRFLSELTTELLVDARYIRQRYLDKLGSHSYGSLVRKHVKGIPRVAVLGSGSLAQEILPWLIDETDVRIFYRSWSHARSILERYEHLKHERLTMTCAGWGTDPAALVVAAPIDSDELNKWIELQGVKFSVILDLRENAHRFSVTASRVVGLKQLFASLREERARLQARVAAARAYIKSRSEVCTSQRGRGEADAPLYNERRSTTLATWTMLSGL
jgi:glutamyl-tRNA reductase